MTGKPPRILVADNDDSMKEGSPAEFVGRRIHRGSPKQNRFRRRTQQCCSSESTSTSVI